MKSKNVSEIRKIFHGVKESKQLRAEKREAWFAIVKKAVSLGLCDYEVMLSSAKEIDSRGIAVCIRASIASGLADILPAGDFAHARVLLDGGLKAPAYFLRQKTIIKGDEKEMFIALASICAKVTRDRKMIAYAKIYPGYGFDIHKGYGTAAHARAIRKHGLSDIHRRSFTRRFHGGLMSSNVATVAKKARIR